MDLTRRRITKIAREVSKFTVRTLKAEGIGASEFDVIHAVRKNPGITQAEICRLLGTDKGAVARQTDNLEGKGYLYRQENPADRRSQQIFPTEKAQLLKNSKAQIETICYEWLAEALTPEEQQEFARLLERIYLRSKAESKAGFPNLTQKVQEAE